MESREILDYFYDSMKDLIFKIYNHNNCSQCSGTFQNISCKYCGHVDKELDLMITDLSLELTKLEMELSQNDCSEIPINKLFNLLMILKDRDIIVVDMLLDEYNYKENYYEFYESLLKRHLEEKDYSALEINVIESMIYSKDSKANLIDYYNMFIKNALLKKQNVSYDCFKVLIKNFLDMQLQRISPKAKCTIDSTLKKECGGSTVFSKVNLNEIDVKSFYEGNSPFLIFIMAHELQHVYQYIEIFHNDLYITPFMMDQIKEFVIQHYNNDYYDQNHDIITFEIEAEVNGIVDGLKYIENIGLELLNKKHYLDKKTKLESQIYNRERIINGTVTTLDDEFEKIITNHPEALLKYKKLSLLYKVVDNKVMAKKDEELAHDLEYILSDTNLNQEKIDMYKDFYRYYMNNTRKV